jgi:hypothetical protein
VTAAFNRLFSTYPQFGTANFDEAVRAYFDAIEPYETQDILAAIRIFLTGSATGHNPAFAPSAPLVGSETRRQMNLRLDSEARSRLPALPPPPMLRTAEQIARVDAMLAEVKANLARKGLRGLAFADRDEDA